MTSNHFLSFRIDPMGSPFRNMDAGVLESRDPENQLLLEEGTQNYLAEFQKENADFSLEPSWVVSNSQWLYPSFGVSALYGLGLAYTRKSSFYVRKILCTGAGIMGLVAAYRQQKQAYNHVLLNNFHRFSPQFQNALESGDARYLRKYHRGPKN